MWMWIYAYYIEYLVYSNREILAKFNLKIIENDVRWITSHLTVYQSKELFPVSVLSTLKRKNIFKYFKSISKSLNLLREPTIRHGPNLIPPYYYLCSLSFIRNN